MFYVLGILVLVVALAVGGALVYRKNAATIEADANKAKAAADALSKK